MTRSADLPEEILWYEGMLLGPQHFQQLELRQERLRHYHAATISPFHWGVHRLEINPAPLVEGTFEVVGLEAVMRDGLLVSSEGVERGALSLDLAGAVEDPTSGPWKVYLAVAAQRGGRSVLTGELARYEESPAAVPVADEVTGESGLPIRRLRPRVRLFVGEEPPAKYSSIPIAEVEYAKEAYRLTDYVAPSLSVPVASPLGRLCSDLARRLREKAVFLSEMVRAPSASQRAPQLVGRKARLASLVAALPALEAAASVGVCHPFPLYLQLCALAGQIAALGSSSIPPLFKPYDHDDLRATFGQADDFMARVITEGFVETHEDYLFELERGVFSLEFDPQWTGRSLVLGVRGRSGAPQREVAAWVENAVIGAESAVGSIQRRRVLGAARSLSDGEGELVPTRGVMLYSVDPDPEFVLAGEPLRIFNPDDPDAERGPDEIVLYVRATPTDAAAAAEPAP